MADPFADPTATYPLEQIRLHGHQVAYRKAGEGPAILLIHGITSSSDTWDRVFEPLSERFTVIAPDLIGHGQSAKPRGDYSMGAYASGLRDLLVALEIDSATYVGHSLGGGIAMQLAYQHPEFCERLVLVSSGGLGPEVSVMLRAATLPGSELVIPWMTKAGVLGLGRNVGHLLGRVGLQPGTDLEEVARGFASLADTEAMKAFVHTLRASVDLEGQRVDARDRLYLAGEGPSLIVWGERDRIIPVKHGREAHELIPGNRLEVFPQSGHFPHRDEPLRFAGLLRDFIESTEPAAVDYTRLRHLATAR
ncbi:MAG TPA: alpha/beta fold hydrolase [Solirubrobacterales bacterium]|nr:alpha/beta fold hydrolase [Solirubrobacterales bacterium]